MKHMHNSNVLVASFALMTLALTGCCGGMQVQSSVADPTSPVPGKALQGQLHGGQQPVAGSLISLFAASTSGYKAAATNLLTVPVYTDGNGGFNITGDYTCTPGQMLYLTAVGGNPTGDGGLDNRNPNLALMAALGDCSTLSASSYISVNELTTVAAAYALAPFMASYSAVGTSATNTSGLVHAFVNAGKLANIANGSVPGAGLPTGTTVPVAELNTLADILAMCVNSDGVKAGKETVCGDLFQNAVPPGIDPPTDTIGLALAMATYPVQNVAQQFLFVGSTVPFLPTLTTIPSDWTVAIRYTGNGISQPMTTTVDASGNVWVANAGNSSLTVLAQSGNPVPGSPFTGGGLAQPSAVAIDAMGTAWVGNQGGVVSQFSLTGGASFTTVAASAGPIGSVAVDTSNDIWASGGQNSLFELSGTGVLLNTVPLQSRVAAIAFRPQ